MHEQEGDGLPISVLVVEDEPSHAEAMSRSLAAAGRYRIRHASSLREGRAALDEEVPRLVLADMNLADGKALDLLSSSEERGAFPLLVLTSHGDEHTAVESMRAGALDYVVKSPEAFAGLPRTIERALREWRLREESRSAERALRDSEETLRVLFAAAPDAFVMHELSGDVVEVNPAAEELLGLPRERILKRTVRELGLSVGDPPGETGRAPSPGDASSRLVREDGKVRLVELRTRTIQLRGRSAALTIARDVTSIRQEEEARRRLEEQLHHAMKMEAIGRLAGGVAHDFNNLLTAILGSTELLIRDVTSGDPMRDDLQEIRDAARRAAALTAQLLAFSRKQVIQPVVLDLNELLGGALRMLQRLIGEDVELAFHAGSSLGSVRVDPSQMEQVFVNLAVNARDAMPQGGRLGIETSRAKVDETFCDAHIDARPGEYVLVAVSDTGSGMEKDVVERIFEPFFTTKGFGRGTGLGLSIIYGIVRQNGGFVLVFSELGHGTTFQIFLPRVEAEPVAVRRPLSVELPRGTERILLVEDEEAVLNLAARFLRRQGFEVVTADRGGDAVLLVERDSLQIDVLLTDVVMPNMNGRELYERLRGRLPDLRVLFMSGYHDDVIAHHGVLDPGTAFLEKPFTLEGLVRKLRDVLDG